MANDMEELSFSESNETQPLKNLKSIKEEHSPGCYVKTRYILVVIQCFGMANLMILRNSISIAIVAMVTTKPSMVTNVNSTSSCPDRGRNPSISVKSNGEFNWNSAEQGLLLGCYYYGYVASNLPGAWFSKRFGMKYTVGIMTLIASVLTLCIPVVAHLSFALLVVVRILTGLLQGAVAPSMIGSWSVWGPSSERNSFISVACSGISVGTVLNLVVSGILAKKLGWQAVFYVSGAAGVVWSLSWICLVHNYPENHPRISKQEKHYIQRTSGQANQINEECDGSSPPWKSVATSLPLWATCVAMFSSNWGAYIVMIYLPTYMATVLNFDIAASGYLSALPYIINFIIMVFAGQATSLAQRKTNISVGVLRRINQTLSLLTTALFLVLVGYVGCNATAAVAFFCVAAGANAFTITGCVANSVDIAPRYGEIMFGICNTFGNLSGFLAPQIAGFILLGSNSIEQWQKVFWVSAGVEVCGAVFYLIFASGEEQEWANKKPEYQEISSTLLE